MANLDKSRFFLCDSFVVHDNCAYDHAFPENVIASALHHGAKCQKKERMKARDNMCDVMG